MEKFTRLGFLYDCELHDRLYHANPTGVVDEEEEEEDRDKTKNMDVILEMKGATLKGLTMGKYFDSPWMQNNIFVLARFKTNSKIAHEKYAIIKKRGKEITMVSSRKFHKTKNFYNNEDKGIFIQVNA
jgi:hypothetical protein